MKKFNLLLSLTVLALLKFSAPSNAQSQAVGLKLGLANYQGDLILKQVDVGESRIAAGVYFRKNLNNQFALRVAADLASIAGDDANYPERKGRGLSFKNNIFAASINGQWNILGKPRFDNNGEFKKQFTPVIFTGLGAVISNPKIKGLGLDAPELEKGGKEYSFFVPFGIGGHYELNPKVTLGLEAATHLPFTDYLDGVSESGKSGNNDWFGLVTFSFQYWIDSPEKMKKPAEDVPMK